MLFKLSGIKIDSETPLFADQEELYYTYEQDEGVLRSPFSSPVEERGEIHGEKTNVTEETKQKANNKDKRRKTKEKLVDFVFKLTVLRQFRELSKKNRELEKKVDDQNNGRQHVDNGDDEKKRRAVLLLWRKFLQDFTLNGFRHIFQASVIRRVIWLFILIAAILAVCFSAHKSIKKYFDRPITTTVNLIYKDEIVFPAVTLCNFNFFPHYLINGTIGEKVIRFSI